MKSSNINQFKTWAEDVIKARTSNLMIPDNSIRNLIKTIRNQQVMLDSDLAFLYGVNTKVLNQAVSRNIERFPEDFMFQLTWEECENLRSQFLTSSLRSQFVTLNSKQGQHIKYLPYAFTEQGVAMLSGVLHSPIAIEANIRIMLAFVGMRHFINENARLFQRIENIECNQLEIVQSQKKIEAHVQESDQKIEELFQRLDEGRTNPKEGIASVPTRFGKIQLTISTDYGKNFNKSHDRFLIIDDEIYHLGASLKDLGKKWFAFSILHCSKELLLNNLCQ